ncbi:MAG: hypothetical protein PHP22_00675 [Oscillospiraceae bacterium]|nr:hypothetical protein [Oscillospiraceae bacterium]
MSDARPNETASFTTLLCLGAVIVFRSATVREAAETALFSAVILLLCAIFRKVGEKGLSLPRILFCEWTATVFAVSVFIAFALLFPSERSTGFAVVGEILYAFLFVPIVADRLNKRSHTELGRTGLLWLIFAVTILSLSAVRELGSVGTLWGIKVLPGIFGRTPYLAHDSSAALILAALLIAARLVIRRHRGEGHSFMTDRELMIEVPYLDVRLEKEHFRIAFILLLGTLLLGAAVFSGVYILSILDLPAFILPPLSVTVQALIVGLLMPLIGKGMNRFAEVFRRPFLLPLQAAVVLLPLRFLFEKGPGTGALLANGLRYLVSLILLWFFCVGLFAFIRTFKRKMLFGRRPKSVDGLPFVFIVMSLGMIVLTSLAWLLKVTV